MPNAKVVGAPLGSHFKLFDVQSPNSDAKEEYMAKVLMPWPLVA